MGKIAFVFSGQGAQYTGMGRELYECSPAAKAVFDMADSIREGTSNQCFEADKETLSITVNTQPCVFTADLAAAAAVAEKGIRPDYLAGFPAPVVTTGIFSSATTFAVSSTNGLISIMFTPKGLSVSSLHFLISALSCSPLEFIAAIIPRPPALLTADAREASATQAIPP